MASLNNSHLHCFNIEHWGGLRFFLHKVPFMNYIIQIVVRGSQNVTQSDRGGVWLKMTVDEVEARKWKPFVLLQFLVKIKPPTSHIFPWPDSQNNLINVVIIVGARNGGRGEGRIVSFQMVKSFVFGDKFHNNFYLGCVTSRNLQKLRRSQCP